MIFTISLTQNKDFLRLYKQGKYINSKECVVYYLPNKLPFNRIGITTSKKVGNAVLRNRARRVIKAEYRKNELSFPVGFDIVIVARSEACDVKSDIVGKFFKEKVSKIISKSDISVKNQKKDLKWEKFLFCWWGFIRK